MIRLAIVVEGQTEEGFVKQVLADHLMNYEVSPTPILVGGRGGDVNVNGLVLDMANSFWSFDFVTSLVDLYGFRGRDSEEPDDLECRINNAVVKRVKRSFDHTRVFPYVQKYEFEGLLFSKVEAFEGVSGATSDGLAQLQNVRSGFPTPEDINDNRETAPSKRIRDALPQYNKRLHGPQVAADIGLETIRAECHRFNTWMTRLEALNLPN